MYIYIYILRLATTYVKYFFTTHNIFCAICTEYEHKEYHRI